jgi:autotransporter-associated beta strand protein
MKPTPLHWSHVLPALAGVLWLCPAGTAPAQLTVNYDFTPGSTVPDNGQLSIAATLGGLGALQSYSNVATRLNLTTSNSNDAMYLGDLYSSLTFGTSSESQRIAVLLDRPGRDTSSPFGSSLSALNVTLDSSAGTNVFNATGNGTFAADGRLGVDPYGAAVSFSAGSNGLAALNGSAIASKRVSLLVADTVGGGTATLSSWGVSVTGTAASTGSFTPGANAFLSDTGSGATNTVGASLITSGATGTGGKLELNIAGTTEFTGAITGDSGINKTGSGTVQLSNNGNAYSGGTSITGGTLLLGASNVLPDGGAVTLGASARVALGGFSETAGSLTLGTNSVIDMGNGATSSSGLASVATFSDLNTSGLTGIKVWNWLTGDKLIFTSGSGSFTTSQVQFFSDAGSTPIGSGATFSGSELVPVPEVGTLFGVLGLMAPLAWRERRHWMRCREARA